MELQAVYGNALVVLPCLWSHCDANHDTYCVPESEPVLVFQGGQRNCQLSHTERQHSVVEEGVDTMSSTTHIQTYTRGT